MEQAGQKAPQGSKLVMNLIKSTDPKNVANQQVTVNTNLLGETKAKLIGGRNAKDNVVDVDFGEKSGVSREQCEFMTDPKSAYLVVKQNPKATNMGFLVEDTPIQLLNNAFIDIGGKGKLFLSVESNCVYPFLQIALLPKIIFSPQIKDPGLTRSTDDFNGQRDRASIILCVSKKGKSKDKRELVKFECDLSEDKIFTIPDDGNFLEDEYNILPELKDLKLEIVYNGKDAQNQYWSIRKLESRNTNPDVNVVYQLMLSNNQDKCPNYVVNPGITKLKMMISTSIYELNWQ